MSVVATPKSASLLLVILVLTATSLHLLKTVKQPEPYNAEAIVLSNMAAVAHAQNLAGGKLVMSSSKCLIWDCHYSHPSSKSFSTKVMIQDCRFQSRSVQDNSMQLEAGKREKE